MDSNKGVDLRMSVEGFSSEAKALTINNNGIFDYHCGRQSTDERHLSALILCIPMPGQGIGISAVSKDLTGIEASFAKYWGLAMNAAGFSNASSIIG